MSLERFAEAETAFKEGRREDGVRLTAEQLELDPNAAANIYRNFTGLLIRHKRYEEAVRWGREGAKVHPRDFDLWNNLGVALRRVASYDEAIEALDRAQKLNPKNPAPLINKGNILNDQRNGPASIALWSKLVKTAPANAEYQRGLGRGHWYAAELDKAAMRMRLATKLKPDYIDAWLDLIAIDAEQSDNPANFTVFDAAAAAMPDEPRIHEAKAVMLRRLGRHRDAEAYLLSIMERFKDSAWIHYQISVSISEWDRVRAHEHMERAIALAPDNVEYRMSLVESLGRTRVDEGAMLEKSYQVLRGALDDVGVNATYLKIATEVLTRVGDFEAADALGDFADMGRAFAESGKHTALLSHLGRVKTPDDRVELMEQHRIWGDKVLARVAPRPIAHPGPRAPNGKIRLGFMSSDLRAHPVAYFSLPLFEHYDKSRFEVYCYSWYLHDEDRLQARIRGMVDAFRWEKEITDRDAAQLIANDQLDMLVELGGSTHMNKLNVMAFKPAPLTASWLGYPHSAGLTTIDHFILDPYLNPPRRELVMEEPLLMPHCWLAMSELAFPDRPINPVIPQTRNGFLTFGTANNPYKYSKAMVRTWARATAAVPDARFLFVRPEGGTPSFRRNIEALFAAEGVSPDRLRFQEVRGQHMQYYNDIDISLDAFPQTGGTTTCESLSMGVPVVSLIGDAVFERMSYSILSNAGLPDLAVHTIDDYVKTAVALAADPDRRQMLRTGLRDMLRASPLGQTRQFAADFYEMIERAVTADHAKAKAREPA